MQAGGCNSTPSSNPPAAGFPVCLAILSGLATASLVSGV
jgi:hypothetical protein